MKALINWFQALVGYVETAFDFLIDIVTDIVYVTKLAYSYLSSLPRLFGFLPSAIVALLVVAFGVVVIYKILGREG